MKLYADLPARRLGQLLSDVGVLLWCLVWAWVGRVVHDAVTSLAGPARQLQEAGTSFHGVMTTAGHNLSNLPVLDDRLAVPFRDAAGVGASIESVGTTLVSGVDRLAVVLGWTTALVPSVCAVVVWALVRGRFIRRAASVQRFIDGAADLDLFALRAMARQPLTRLARISDDPGSAWRRGDADVIASLALLELRDAGLRPPAPSFARPR